MLRFLTGVTGFDVDTALLCSLGSRPCKSIHHRIHYFFYVQVPANLGLICVRM